MKYCAGLSSVLSFISAVTAGTTVWSGSFNSYSTATDFDKWSWSSEVGEYQWYIHGTQPTTHYLALDPSFKNPADTAETHGLKMTIDTTATWNSQMERAELIPQTTANLGQGNLFYHFSLMHSSTNPPESTLEHQIFFFESHFTELKYGVGPNNTNLEWHVQSQPQWGVPFTAGVWYNFAYDIDFSGGTVGLWASQGASPLVKVAANRAASTSTNSEDFHVGVLRIVNDATTEDWYVSGVYIESGPITTAIGNGSSPPPSSVSTPSVPTPPPSSSAPATTTKPVPPTTTTKPVPPTTSGSPVSVSPPPPLQTQYGQCGGNGYTGPTTCASPFTCKAISPPYYSQCL